jgi:hypothetical protein
MENLRGGAWFWCPFECTRDELIDVDVEVRECEYIFTPIYNIESEGKVLQEFGPVFFETERSVKYGFALEKFSSFGFK